VRPVKPSAFFVAIQKTEYPLFRFRLYNVVGDHPLSGSTVTVDTLIGNGIPVPDLSDDEIQRECEMLQTYLVLNP
jgi:hypothetical protein